MSSDMTFFSYFSNAGLIIRLVITILIASSILSWVFIFQRAFFLKQASKELKQFEERFWQSNELSRLFAQIENSRAVMRGLASVFYAGFREFKASKTSESPHVDFKQQAVIRAMRVASAKETEKLERHLSFLASVGSVSPYIGLFGTVWGIMTAFQALGNVGQASIAMVAPGISEALVVTAMGLFAAIPAVLAYNRFANQVESLVAHYDVFQDELTNILQHQDKL